MNGLESVGGWSMGSEIGLQSVVFVLGESSIEVFYHSDGSNLYISMLHCAVALLFIMLRFEVTEEEALRYKYYKYIL